MDKGLLLVIPYRDRKSHLEKFLPQIEAFLEKQGIRYNILIVEQTDGKSFNRAKLSNIGFEYTKGRYEWYCIHDVDMLPIESDYRKCHLPTHLGSNIEQFGYKMPYESFFGGVVLFDPESFQRINGFSNNYWGWGGEDDDMFYRFQKMKVCILRRYGRYHSLSHERSIVKAEYEKNVKNLKEYDKCFKYGEFREGLSTLKYTILKTKQISDTVSIITVDI